MVQQAVSINPPYHISGVPAHHVAYLIGGGLTMATASRAKFTEGLGMHDLMLSAIIDAGRKDEFAKDEQTAGVVNSLITAPQDTHINLEEVIELLYQTERPVCRELAEYLAKRFGDLLEERSTKLEKDSSENCRGSRYSATFERLGSR